MLDFEKTADELHKLVSRHYDFSSKEIRLLETLRAYLLNIRPEFSLGFDDFKKLFKCEYTPIRETPFIDNLVYEIKVTPRIELNVAVRKDCIKGFGMSWNLKGFSQEGNNENFLQLVFIEFAKIVRKVNEENDENKGVIKSL